MCAYTNYSFRCNALIMGQIGILPSHFDTPMFWNDEDLQELQGTSVVGLCSVMCSITSLDMLCRKNR